MYPFLSDTSYSVVLPQPIKPIALDAVPPYYIDPLTPKLTNNVTVEITSSDGSTKKTNVPVMPYFPVSATVYTQGTPTLPYGLNLDNDPNIHVRATKYIMYKILDDWLQIGGEMHDLLKRCKLVGKKIVYGKTTHNLSQDASDKIITYLENNVITYDYVKKILKMIVTEAKFHWYNFFKKEYENLVIDLLKKSIAIKLKNK
jgi:hypothetical protein